MDITYKDQLMGTTALCRPTYHKGLAGIIGIVASIAIPFAAPAIASSMMLSGVVSAIGMGATSGLIGGVMGAGIAAMTEGNVLMGGIGGALAGGIAGFNAPGASISTGAPGSNISTAGFPSSSPAALAPAPTATGLVSAPPVGGFGMDQMPGVMTAGPAAPLTVPPPTAASTLSGGGGRDAATWSIPPSPSTTLSGGGPDAATWGIPPSPSTTWPGANMDATTLSSAPTVTAGLQPSAGAPPGFFDSLPSFLTSEAAQQGAGKLLTNALSGQFVGDTPDMSDEEKRRLAQLNAARNQQLALQNKKIGISDSFLQRASSINPLYYGQQALADEQNRLSRAQEAGLRAIPTNSNARASAIRRNALDKSRLGGFQTGQDAAEDKRRLYTASAANALPTGSGIANDFAGDLAAADKRYDRLGAAGDEFQDIFAPIAQDIFTDDPKKKLDSNATQ